MRSSLQKKKRCACVSIKEQKNKLKNRKSQKIDTKISIFLGGVRERKIKIVVSILEALLFSTCNFDVYFFVQKLMMMTQQHFCLGIFRHFFLFFFCKK